ncbi:sensor histidine kinase [Oryzifoliimicrobium ureilyticus]|uniref:sensor histidine kinase n=1 Tax=Oryzifoliimicrobium ureilyticus TaxID=3113724 RepID=UPI003075F1BE
MSSRGEHNATQHQQDRRLRLRGFALASLIVAVFVADTVTQYEVAIAVFYIVVIVLAVGYLSIRGVIRLAGLCVGLTALSLFLTQHGSFDTGVLNAIISTAAIGITTYLVLKTLNAQATVFEAQTQLARATRLASLAALTASIAHEVNQPLAAVVTSADASRRWLDRDPPNIEKAVSALARIAEDASRAGEVIKRVRSLAKSDAPDRKLSDFNTIVHEAVAITQGELEKNNILVKLSLEEDLPLIPVDRIQIIQIVINLLLNAIDAMRHLPSFKRVLSISSFRQEDDTLSLVVADVGTGIEPAVLEHLFEAFWTTKEHGMGVGLSITRTMVEAHGGTISVSSRPRIGTEFTVSLPVPKE